MSSTAKIRLGATIVIVGELFALATMWEPAAANFVAFVFVVSIVILAGAALGTWGVVEHEHVPHAHARKGDEAPHRHVRHGE